MLHKYFTWLWKYPHHRWINKYRYQY